MGLAVGASLIGGVGPPLGLLGGLGGVGVAVGLVV